MIDQKLVLEKCFCDLAFTDFQMRCQKSETILENKMFQKFKLKKKKNVNNYFDIEIDFENLLKELTLVLKTLQGNASQFSRTC